MSVRKKNDSRPTIYISSLPAQKVYEQYVKDMKRLQVKKIDDEHLNDSLQNPREVGRDSKISLLLSTYVNTYIERQKNNKSFRERMFRLCMYSTYGIITIMMVGLAYGLFCTKRSVTDIAAMVTVSVSAIGSIAFLLEIVARYVFPANEEEHIATMVQAIQKNDLEERKLRYENLTQLQAREYANKEKE